MRTFDIGRVPIRAWVDELDDSMVDQAEHLANLTFAFKHIAIMPDTHRGYGMPIGGVLATRDVVIPNAVGVDIGCGVRAWRTGLDVETFMPERDAVLREVRETIPTGFERRDRAQRHPVLEDPPDSPPIREHLDVAAHSLGTLGGGNHFIEVQRDDEDGVWVMLHSGSRNLGKQVCDHYAGIARDLGRRWDSEVPDSWQLAYLPLDLPEGREYMRAMCWCLHYAKANRETMMWRIREVFDRHFEDHAPDEHIDVHHNYAAAEHHFGEDVMVHRKGAVRAVGAVIVPGSMGAPSFVCRGLANPDSFQSCAHGAGRRMGRKEAKRRMSSREVAADMRTRDISLLAGKKSAIAEEAREAYKDIEEIMRLQSDLVEVQVRLEPLGVVKG